MNREVYLFGTLVGESLVNEGTWVGLTRWLVRKVHCGKRRGLIQRKSIPTVLKTHLQACPPCLECYVLVGRQTHFIINSEDLLLLIFGWVDRSLCSGMRQKYPGLKCQIASGKHIQPKIHVGQGGLLCHVRGEQKDIFQAGVKVLKLCVYVCVQVCEIPLSFLS